MSSHIYLSTEMNQKKLLPDYHWVFDLIQRHNGPLSIASCYRSTAFTQFVNLNFLPQKRLFAFHDLLIDILEYVFLCHQLYSVQIPQCIWCRLHPGYSRKPSMFSASLAISTTCPLNCFPGIQNLWVILQPGIRGMTFKWEMHHRSLKKS